MNSWKFRLTKAGRQRVTDGRGKERERGEGGGKEGSSEEGRVATEAQRDSEVIREMRSDEEILAGRRMNGQSLGLVNMSRNKVNEHAMKAFTRDKKRRRDNRGKSEQ